MASTAVFDTYELLEQILLHLPVTDLLLSQQVCKKWQQVVHRSRGIRCALFIEDFFDDGAHAVPSPNDPIGLIQRWHFAEANGAEFRVVVNPLLNEFFDSGAYGDPLLHYGPVAPVNINNPMDPFNFDPWSRRCRFQSWKAMRMFQPWQYDLLVPCKPALFGRYNERYNLGSNLSAGGVVDRLRAHWFECPDCPIKTAFDYDENITNNGTASWEFYPGGHQLVASDITGWEMLSKLQGLCTEDEEGKDERRGW